MLSNFRIRLKFLNRKWKKWIIVVPAIMILLSIFVLCFLKSSLGNDAPLSGETTVTFLSVGMADCTLIRDDDTVVMIDAGAYSSEDEIFSFLYSQQIEAIDLLILTHPHSDHIGCAGEIVRSFEVGEIWMTEYPQVLEPDSSGLEYLFQITESTGTEITTARPGDIFELKNSEITVLFAGGQNLSDLNQCSMVLRCDAGNRAFLFTGDADRFIENLLVESGTELEADVLKVGHHGSSDSSSAVFLQQVDPIWAIVSCGLDNIYGFPKEDVVERLQEIGAEILRTDLDGTVLFRTNGFYLRCTTSG